MLGSLWLRRCIGLGFRVYVFQSWSHFVQTWVWGDDGNGKSSNWRELTNLVETLEGEAREGRLQGCEVFVFTDNSTAEAAFFKGTSSSILLFDLVLRLRKIGGGSAMHVACDPRGGYQDDRARFGRLV